MAQGNDKPKRGRPKFENPRTAVVATTLTEAELERVDVAAEKENKPRAAFIRQLVLEAI